MTPSPPAALDLPKRRRPPGILIAMLVGGIIFAITDSIAVHRGLTQASDLASAFGGTVESTRTSVTWFRGLLPIGEVEYPRVWAALGGFITGTIIGAVAFFVIRAIFRAIRTRQ